MILTFFFSWMTTMKENKGKEVVDEEIRLEVQSQPRFAVGDERKNFSKAIDLENLPSCCKEKRVKHRLSKPGLPILPTSQQLSIQIQDLDQSKLDIIPSSKTIVPTSSQPSQRVPLNLIEKEDLAWERFEKVMTDENVAVCYDMSLIEFEHSAVYDLFKVCNYFYLVLSQ